MGHNSTEYSVCVNRDTRSQGDMSVENKLFWTEIMDNNLFFSEIQSFHYKHFLRVFLKVNAVLQKDVSQFYHLNN